MITATVFARMVSELTGGYYSSSVKLTIDPTNKVVILSEVLQAGDCVKEMPQVGWTLDALQEWTNLPEGEFHIYRELRGMNSPNFFDQFSSDQMNTLIETSMDQGESARYQIARCILKELSFHQRNSLSPALLRQALGSNRPDQFMSMAMVYLADGSLDRVLTEIELSSATLSPFQGE